MATRRTATVTVMAQPGQTLAEMQAELNKLKAENEQIRAQAARNAHVFSGISCKIAAKGGVSVYGLGRFPVTLFESQWDKLIANIDDVAEFIKVNRHKLSHKE